MVYTVVRFIFLINARQRCTFDQNTAFYFRLAMLHDQFYMQKMFNILMKNDVLFSVKIAFRCRLLDKVIQYSKIFLNLNQPHVDAAKD